MPTKTEDKILQKIYTLFKKHNYERGVSEEPTWYLAEFFKSLDHYSNTDKENYKIGVCLRRLGFKERHEYRMIQWTCNNIVVASDWYDDDDEDPSIEFVIWKRN